MGRTLTVTHEDDDILPEDEFFDAKVDSLDFKTINYKDKTTGEDKSFEKIYIFFKITTPNQFEGQKIRGEADFVLSNRRPRLLEWASAILDRPISVGSDLDMDELLGNKVKITVRHVPGYKDPSRKFAEIDVVLPGSGDSGYDAPPF